MSQSSASAPGSDRGNWTAEELRLAKEMVPYLVECGWIESRRRRESVDRDGRPIPWITYPAMAFLERRVGDTMEVFEFGSGNSTLWWAERVRHISAVEHDEAWAARVATQAPANADVSHVPLDANGEYSRSAQRSQRQYHIVVVDGRDRVNCAVASISCLREDGVVIWDNTERRRYASGLATLMERGFRRIEFRGPSPIGNWASETSILYRTGNCLGI
jgi:hypothetical protein